RRALGRGALDEADPQLAIVGAAGLTGRLTGAHLLLVLGRQRGLARWRASLGAVVHPPAAIGAGIGRPCGEALHGETLMRGRQRLPLRARTAEQLTAGGLGLTAEERGADLTLRGVHAHLEVLKLEATGLERVHIATIEQAVTAARPGALGGPGLLGAGRCDGDQVAVRRRTPGPRRAIGAGPLRATFGAGRCGVGRV